MAPLALLAGGGSKTLCCCGSIEYSRMILMSLPSAPRSTTSLLIRLQASSVSRKRVMVQHLMQSNKNQTDTWRNNGGQSGWEGGGRGGGKPWFPATLHLFLLSLHLTEEIKVDHGVVWRAPCGSVVKCSNHGKHRRVRSPRHVQPERLKQGSLFHSAVL